ncbi:MAG: D-alpha,beta-D-heptose 1,7-bisphosphate phosphatase [Candidatus Giovannonibacteria bacterium GW2011_GWB1_47_6b]|uniref:D,D-heptose 1,7-bisphosphate phosphatase n=1 Tax=Candidatus Giovannonibacteria bacterium GW2011_GWB1_47_6b TaxID=1618655 RepID=A0A0G1T0M7_9BACT|nr:MAG: D-alpha,beta-D-heptose 1,7-bisphosphate phosphatase [Candidatus Giovannonibacteria bacterium GW2011_GWB1_47_6b]
MRKGVFLDRDGVINQLVTTDHWFASPYVVEDFHILPGVPEAIKILKNAGFVCVVVTNQPDIARGKFTDGDLRKIHDFMQSQLGLDGVYYCPHDEEHKCPCRKPKPGMILQAAKELEIDLSKSFVVGDRWRDVDMGPLVGCKTVLINTEATKRENKKIKADWKADNLLEAATIIARA